MNTPPHLSLDSVSIRLPLLQAEARSLKKTLLGAAGRIGKTANNRLAIEALRDITLDIRAGERVGLIGGNGAGKTTLLRVLAGIYEPADGTVRTAGRVHSLLHANQGMHPDLSGRENIRLAGLYRGLSTRALRQLEDDVASFAELGDFLHLPLRTYSTGMMVRLGFALATAMRPQILLMDEWILAGDAAFMHKAQARLAEQVRAAEILVLATHQDQVLRDWCTRAIWLDQGRVCADGNVGAILSAYHHASAA